MAACPLGVVTHMFRRFAIAAVLVAGAAAPALAFGGWHGPFIGPVGGFLFLLALVALVVLTVSMFGAGRRRRAYVAPAAPAASAGPAFAILAERFARGDIDAREYDARRRVLAGEREPDATKPESPAAPAATPPAGDVPPSP